MELCKLDKWADWSVLSWIQPQLLLGLTREPLSLVN